MITLGWYVHHHGRGHVHRARAVCRELSSRGIGVTVLSSLPDEGWAPWVELPRDDAGGFRDVDAHGLLHYAPTDNPGHRRRLARIASWVAEAGPAAAVVDVSVEVTMWLRVQGVRTVVMAMPGVRDDTPHRIGYRAADRIIAPWPGTLERSAWLQPYAARVHYVGGISRYDGRGAPAEAFVDRAGSRTVLVIGGVGGSDHGAADVEAARAATPDWSWRVIDADDWVADPWPLLHAAEVVVTGAGQGSVADLAAAGSTTLPGTPVGRSAIVIPQDRPYGEQAATARVLRRHGLAVVRDKWPAAAQWPALLSAATSLAPRWEAWETTGAASRAADVIVEMVREHA